MRQTRRALTILLAACTIALSAPLADAQPRRDTGIDLTTVRPPSPAKQDDPPTIRSYFLLALLVAAAVGANCIPSKRGHQD
ncbi:MAG: hypothetical protein KIT19_07135 [Phycisphaeraceae bacterium]|nr:hypothetical protein [Phycisphaeraceae bacterium]